MSPKDILSILQENHSLSSKILHKEIENTLSQIPYVSFTEAKSLASQVMKHFLGITQIDIMLDKTLPTFSPPQQKRLGQVLTRLLSAEPLQYIIGEVQFYDLSLSLSPDVLIPRPETEEIIDYVLRKHRSKPPLRILDLGTGSGCIGIALAKNFPDSEVWALDISEKALKVAQHNAVKNQVKIHFRQADMLQLKMEDFPQFSMIVSNPPYVTESEKKVMHANVLEYEPASALFVPDQNPLLFYEAIAQFAQKKLLPEGAIYLEINELFGEEMKQLLQNYSFGAIQLHQDMQGKNRFISALHL